MSKGIALSGKERSSEVWGLVLGGLVELGILCLLGQWLVVQFLAWHLRFDSVLDRDLLVDLGTLRFVGVGLVVSLFLYICWRGWRWLNALSVGVIVACVVAASHGSIYHPLALWRWRRALGDADLVGVANLALYGVALLWCVAGIAILVEGVRKGSEREGVGAHGTGRLATKAEFHREGFLPGRDSGFPVGCVDGKMHLNDSELHVLVTGATGSGKTAGFLAPGLLCHGAWGPDAEGPAVVYDPKEGGELFRLTSGHLQRKGRRVYRWDARNPERLEGGRSCYNPLLDIPRSDEAVAAVQRMGEYFVRSGGEGDKNKEWKGWARDLFEAFALHVVFAEEVKTVGRITELLAQGSLREVMTQLVMTSHDPELSMGWTREGVPTETHPYIVQMLLPKIKLAAETLSGIEANFLAAMKPYTEPFLAGAMSRSDFSMEEICSGRAVLFLTGVRRDAKRVQPVCQLIIDTVMSAMETRVEDLRRSGQPMPQHRLLVVLDELPFLGTMESLAENLQAVRSSYIRFVLGIQTIRQLRKYYGGAEELVSVGCPLSISLGAEDQTTAKIFSEMVGERTVQVASKSIGKGGGSVSNSEIRRAVITPDELRAGFRGKALVVAPNLRPAMTDVRFYFEDPEMTAWVEQGPKVIQTPRTVPNVWDGQVGMVPTLRQAAEAFGEAFGVEEEDLF